MQRGDLALGTLFHEHTGRVALVVRASFGKCQRLMISEDSLERWESAVAVI